MNLDTIKDDLLSIGDSGIKYAKSKLSDASFEIYLSQNNTITVDINGGSVIARDSMYSGSAVRVYNNKRKSFACTSGIGIDNIKTTIDEAISISNSISFVDDRFHSLYTPNGKKESNEGIIDFEIVNLNSKALGDEANRLVQDCKINEKIISISGTRETSFGAFAVVNSAGVHSASRYTVNAGVVEPVAKEGNKQTSSFNYCITRNVKDFDLTNIGIEASKESISLLNSKKLNNSDKMPILWDVVAASLYFHTAISSPISGKNVVEGNSYFADKIADTVGSPQLHVIDDGQLPEAMSTFSIDGEGVPSQKTTIMDKGILKSFITDSYYGYLMETASTSNSKRNSNPGYEGLPQISTNTLVIKESNNKTIDDLVKEIDNGIFVKGFLLGIGHTNPITGDMSAVSPASYLIENGEIKHALEAVNIAGNVYKSLKDIKAIGSETVTTPFGVKTAPLIVDGFTVTG